jgi:DNA-binding transcriptional LysR family regulator
VLELVVGRRAAVPGVQCRFKPIEDEALAVIAGTTHPLVRRRSVPFRELVAYPWILQPTGSPMRDVIEHEFRHHVTELPRGLVETGSILTTINLVRASQMLGVIPQAVAHAHAQAGMIAVVPYRFRHALESYGTLVPRERPLSAPAQRFVELLHAGGA